MRKPSRLMPKFEAERTPPLAWLIAGALVAGAVWLLWQRPWLLACAAVIVAVGVLFGVRERNHIARLRAEREHDSICHFARSFNCRDVDTWIVRAAYEELQEHVSHERPLPIRADDRLREDLRLDEDDLDLDLASRISRRTGRTLGDAEANPWAGKVKTARDLVMFFASQPKQLDPDGHSG
jgi:hypothetical protein